jgi:hypothetical protein
MDIEIRPKFNNLRAVRARDVMDAVASRSGGIPKWLLDRIMVHQTTVTINHLGVRRNIELQTAGIGDWIIFYPESKNITVVSDEQFNEAFDRI